MSVIQTTGGSICNICHTMIPVGQLHYCGGLPSGPHFARQFSEDEIRQIVREEIQRADTLRRESTDG